MYTYSAVVYHVVDGDTVDAKVDLGFYITYDVRLRLIGINSPETKTVEGKAAKAYVQQQLEGKTVTVVTTKTDKYGRYLATITLDGVDFNRQLVDLGYAVPYMV